MSGRVTVENRLPTFKARLNIALDSAVRELARDVLVNAKNTAPHDKGGLRSDSSVKRQGASKYRVSFFKEYARFQEFGGDGRRTVRNYTTVGTGAHYLKNAGDSAVKRVRDVVKKHARRVK